ncbi:uracil-DNA glycosylase [Tissierella sp. Yu-01]|uniref:uracil-DNA glycosylase n=1 Tax=Tissierella sp. Yu-01 TaxID=3035694 RepID=UPI00240E97EF|nr:uracil-DNA glycosylase [Tissierella sp. Yu-01]WFA09250.1 uracil-DNA glycosylase [Tissierella sp. Yu-01]
MYLGVVIIDSNFIPMIWQEEEAPLEALNYGQCEVCTEKSRIIWGEGNPKASIVVILDNPGAREDKEGRQYVCGTRQTLQKVIHQVNLKSDNIYVTYLLKCRPLRQYDKERARAFSKPYLIQQINTIQPKFIVCLGDVVVKSMFNDKEASVKNLRGSWHTIMGYPTIVSYHPLAVRRRPNLMKYFIQDWEMLAKQN